MQGQEPGTGMKPPISMGQLLRHVFRSKDSIMRWGRNVGILFSANFVLFAVVSNLLASGETPSADTLWWSSLFQNIATEMLGVGVSAFALVVLVRVIELNPDLI